MNGVDLNSSNSSNHSLWLPDEMSDSPFSKSPNPPPSASCRPRRNKPKIEEPIELLNDSSESSENENKNNGNIVRRRRRLRSQASSEQSQKKRHKTSLAPKESRPRSRQTQLKTDNVLKEQLPSTASSGQAQSKERKHERKPKHVSKKRKSDLVLKERLSSEASSGQVQGKERTFELPSLSSHSKKKKENPHSDRMLSKRGRPSMVTRSMKQRQSNMNGQTSSLRAESKAKDRGSPRKQGLPVLSPVLPPSPVQEPSKKQQAASIPPANNKQETHLSPKLSESLMSLQRDAPTPSSPTVSSAPILMRHTPETQRKPSPSHFRSMEGSIRQSPLVHSSSNAEIRPASKHTSKEEQQQRVFDIQQMFPTFDASRITLCLEACGGDVSAATELCLQDLRESGAPSPRTEKVIAACAAADVENTPVPSRAHPRFYHPSPSSVDFGQEWCCGRCTFINPSIANTFCGACDAPVNIDAGFRPAPSLVLPPSLRTMTARATTLLPSNIDSPLLQEDDRTKEEDKDEVEEKEENEDEETLVKCPVCFDDKNARETFKCRSEERHTVCFECANEYLASCLKGGIANPKCPGNPKCSYLLDHQDFRTILGNGDESQGQKSQTYIDLDQLQLDRSLAANPDEYVTCPELDCTWTQARSGKGVAEEATCGNCHLSFCTKCGVHPYHFRVSCQQYKVLQEDWRRRQAEREGNEAEKKLREQNLLNLQKDENEMATNCRLCPHCSRIVWKLEGCNIMYCGFDTDTRKNVQNGCGKRFDWNTAKKYVPDLPTAVDGLNAAAASSGKKHVDGLNAAAASSGKKHVHEHWRCDGCEKKPIVGLRFECMNCGPTVSFCEECEPAQTTSTHCEGKHAFRVFEKPE